MQCISSQPLWLRRGPVDESSIGQAEGRERVHQPTQLVCGDIIELVGLCETDKYTMHPGAVWLQGNPCAYRLECKSFRVCAYVETAEDGKTMGSSNDPHEARLCLAEVAAYQPGGGGVGGEEAAAEADDDAVSPEDDMGSGAGLNGVQQEVEMQQAAAGGNAKATCPRRRRKKRKKQPPLPGWRVKKYASATGRDLRHFIHIKSRSYVRSPAQMRRKDKKLRSCRAGTRTHEEESGGGTSRDLGSEERAATATPQAADHRTDLDDADDHRTDLDDDDDNDDDSSEQSGSDEDEDSSSDYEEPGSGRSSPEPQRKRARRGSASSSRSAASSDAEPAEAAGLAAGDIIFLWRPEDACHHRAVVGSVCDELQGERTPVTMVRVRFQAVAGDRFRAVEPLHKDSLMKWSPQEAAARDKEPVGWLDNSRRTWCSSEPTSAASASPPPLALLSTPPPPRSASAPQAERCAARPLRCLEICACTGRAPLPSRNPPGPTW